MVQGQGSGGSQGPFPEGHVWQEWDQETLIRNWCQNLWVTECGEGEGRQAAGGVPCSGGS